MFSPSDIKYMQRALQLAARGNYSTSPNPRVGCVIVKEQQVIAEGFHLKAGSLHAEAAALKQIGEMAYGATVYVTLEPCCHYGRTPPCTQALIDHKVKKVIIATLDPNLLVAGKGVAALIRAGIDVQVGLLEKEARTLNRGFFSRIERKQPYVNLKCATSLDGKVALANGQSKWITSDLARKEVQKLRAQSCAVLTSIQTVIADDPLLNVRDFEVLRQPKRVIVDTNLRTPLSAKIIQPDSGGQCIIATGINDKNKWQAYLDLGVEIIYVPLKNHYINLSTLLFSLAEQEIGELLLEIGGTLNGAFLQENLIDEISWFQAAKILGDKGRGVFSIDGLTNMNQIQPWHIDELRQIDKTDFFLRLLKNSPK